MTRRLVIDSCAFGDRRINPCSNARANAKKHNAHANNWAVGGTFAAPLQSVRDRQQGGESHHGQTDERAVQPRIASLEQNLPDIAFGQARLRDERLATVWPRFAN